MSPDAHLASAILTATLLLRLARPERSHYLRALTRTGLLAPALAGAPLTPVNDRQPTPTKRLGNLT